MKNIVLISFILISSVAFAQKSTIKKSSKQSAVAKKAKLISEFTANLVAYTSVSEEHPIGEASSEVEILFSEYGIKFECVKFTPSNEKCVFNYTDKKTNRQSAEIGVGESFFTMYSPIKKIYVEAKYVSVILNKEYPLQSKTRVKFSVYEFK